MTIRRVALADVHRAQPAGRHRADARRRGHRRPGQLLLPARHPPVRGRGRHRDRHGRRSARTSRVDDVGDVVNPLIVEGQVHGGLAQGIAQALYEEARLRRRRQPGHRHAGRLPGARRRPTCRTSSPTGPRPRRPRNPLGRQGRRRGRHHRLDPGGGQRRSSTRCGTSASTTSRCPARRSGSGGPSRARGGDRPRGRAHRPGRRPTQGQPAGIGTPDRAEARHDPGAVRLRPARARWTRRSRRWPAAATTPRCIAGGQSLLPLLRLRLAVPGACWSTCGGSTSCAASRDDGDALRHRRA